MLAALRTQVEALSGLRTGVTDESSTSVSPETEEALGTALRAPRLTPESVESAASNLTDKEHELAAFHRHFTESSARIEAVVDDIARRCRRFPTWAPTAVEELATRVERVESAARGMRSTSEGRRRLARRIEAHRSARGHGRDRGRPGEDAVAGRAAIPGSPARRRHLPHPSRRAEVAVGHDGASTTDAPATPPTTFSRVSATACTRWRPSPPRWLGHRTLSGQRTTRRRRRRRKLPSAVAGATVVPLRTGEP